MMGYAVYEDRHALDYGVDRWAGYGVPAKCDHPDCDVEIDRGFAYLCGDDPMDDNPGEHRDGECMGCGLYFCAAHRFGNHEGFDPKPDAQEWEHHVLTDESWAQWRDENPSRVAEMRARATHEHQGGNR